MSAGKPGPEIFHLYLVKPSHYDDEGYVIQWLRSAMPSNTLATLNGLVVDCIGRQVLGPDVAIVNDTDLSLQPVNEDEFDELEMFAVSESAKAAVEKKRREDGQRARLKAAS